MKVRRTWYDVVIEVLCLLVLVGISIYLMVRWNSLPDQVPGHYNAQGTVDRWGSKGELLTLPIVSFILYIGITVLEKYPAIWNTGVKVTEENKERVYRALKSMIGTSKLTVVLCFGFLQINSMNGTALPWFFLPVFLLLLFGGITFYIVRLVRIK